jgi:hypothetical protein
MRLADTPNMPWQNYAGQRGTGLLYKHLFEGVEGRPDNYEMRIIRFSQEADYYAPRHRHNFDQFRWPLRGEINYAPGLDLFPGQLGYFPEGAHYGPQEIPAERDFMIVQFAGANGDGYMGAEQTARGVAELQSNGEFVRGVYKGTSAEGKPYNKDGYEAVWEQVNGRSIEYSTPRYTTTIVMDPDAYGWIPMDSDGTVAIKRLGSFTERSIDASLLKVKGSGKHTVVARPQVQLGFVIDGQCEIEGHTLGETAGFELQPSESLDLSASTDMTFLLLSMPNFSG